MEKNRLLLIPLFLGLSLMFYSWYMSFPLTVDTIEDVTFTHVSILYWVSLPIVLISLFMIGLSLKNDSYKWIIAVGFFVTLYSISYFYMMLSGSDSQFFRGFNEYFIETENLNPSQPNHWYYQWPSFFVLSFISSSVSGLSLTNFEFVLYTLIGFMLATSLHFYAFRRYPKNSFLIVPAFIISIFYFLNYQCVPFSLALGLLFLVFMMEALPKSTGLTIVTIILYLSMTITHAFIPLFFVLYLLMRAILEKTRHYLNLFLMTLVIFFLVQLTLAQYGFANSILRVLESSSEYSIIVSGTLTPASAPIDVIAQMFSRTVTFGFIGVCVAGFIALLIRRKLKAIDKAILFTGVIYSGLGLFLSSLGWRALLLIFIPISTGAVYIIEGNFKKPIKYIFSILIIFLLVCFTFIPIHQSFTNSVQFQTIEARRTDNFLVEHLKWEPSTTIYAGFRVITYLQTKINHTNLTPWFRVGKEAEVILYTVELGKDLLVENYSMARFFSEGKLNVAYNNGFSYITIKPKE